ncbi:hypothetical protein ACFRQM_35935 [Streptomyces sp. NPDC056831]|uniref:hypothetical protein n=1 Tax=Streptomyces sp. NPDC056831 TaxID=3345954 RepID=UPI0036941172
MVEAHHAVARGELIAGTGLSAPHPPGERLLHHLALTVAGTGLECAGRTALTEREVRSAEATPGRVTEVWRSPAHPTSP